MSMELSMERKKAEHFLRLYWLVQVMIVFPDREAAALTNLVTDLNI